MKPLLQGLQQRAVGIHLHVSCLPGRLGIGQIGAQARAFVDFLAAAQCSYWQTCPLGPTGFGDSPYQCFSSFAGNPYFIDLEELKACGLITDLSALEGLSQTRVDFGGLWQQHRPIMAQAYQRFCQNPEKLEPIYGSYEAFKDKQAAWLRPYALFRALKRRFDQNPWWQWPQEYSLRSSQTLLPQDEMECFCQYVFWAQWQKLRGYARQRGVSIIGDLPIYVSHDSVEAWAQPELFDMHPNGDLKTLAGVPPDYFSPTGQLWGNPLYNWEVHKAQDYAWWLKRLEHQFEYYDILRIDHFRAFDSYWAIPAGQETAIKGVWKTGPGLDFFQAVKKALPQKRFIAEDLGDLLPSVHALLAATGLPGMQVLQFAFGSDATNTHLPHNTQPNTVLYTSTHDNDTFCSWYASSPEVVKDRIRRYLRVDGSRIAWDAVRCAYASCARLVVIPLSDLLSLGPQARLNTPGQAQGNWQWRVEAAEYPDAEYLRELAVLYNREIKEA